MRNASLTKLTHQGRSVYDLPDVYETALEPYVGLVYSVKKWIDQYCENNPTSLIDPACGPGIWLRLLSVPYAHGNDINPLMIAWARKCSHNNFITYSVGDMCHLPLRQNEQFDIAINLEGSVGHLPNLKAVESHLHSMAACLKPNAIYMLGLTLVSSPSECNEPYLLHDSEWKQTRLGRLCRVQVRSVLRNGLKRREDIEYSVLFDGGDENNFTFRFSSLTFEASEIRDIVERSGFEIADVRSMEVQDYPIIDLWNDVGDVTLILRRTSKILRRVDDQEF